MNDYDIIAAMEAECCNIESNYKRRDKIEEMHRYTKLHVRERQGKPAPVEHDCSMDFNSKGELIGFFIKHKPNII